MWWYLNKTINTSDSKVESKTIKKLTVAMTDGPLNSFFPSSDISEYHYGIGNQISEGLVAYEDITKIVPRLATSWSNPDETTWVFDLKKGVKFHTGRTMTADDVVYSINKAKAIEEMGVYAGTIQSIKALSPYKVEIKTDGPDAVLLNRIAFLPIIDSKEKDSNTLNGGTGPYILKKGTKPTNSHLELVAFNQYHGGEITTRELKFYLVNSQGDAIKDVKSGRANFGGELPSKKISGVGKDDTILDISGNTVGFIVMNTLKPDSPLAKKEVRQAIRYTVDKEKLMKAGNISGETINQLVPKTIPGYNSNIPPHKINIAKAKELMASAGYTGGFSLSLYYYKIGNEKVVPELIKQLGQIGIKITTYPQNEFGDLYDSITSGKTDLATLAYASDTYDALDVYDGMLKQLNQFNSPEIYQDMDKASTIFNSNDRLLALQKIAGEIDEEVPVIPLYNRSYFWLLDKDSYYIKRDVPTAGMGIYFWKVHKK